MGERIEAKKNNESNYRVGQIVARHRNGTYDIAFDQGGEALDVPPSSIRHFSESSSSSPRDEAEEDGHHHNNRPKSSQVRHTSPTRGAPVSANKGNKPSSSSSKFKVGDQIEAQREGKSTYRFAVIAKVHDDGTYDVVYSDRFRENNVPEDRIEFAFADTDTNNTQVSAPSNETVTASTSAYRSDEVQGHHQDDEEEPTQQTMSAPIKSNKSPQRPQTAPKSASKESATSGDRRFKVDIAIEAKYDGGMMYYPGTIMRVDYDERTATIRYDDGDIEENVSFDWMKLPNEATPRRPPRKNGEEARIKFPIGSKVDANYKGTGKWYPGVVNDIRNEDGEYVYCVNYNDGDVDENMSEDMIREPAPKAAKAPKVVGSGQNSSEDKKSPLQSGRRIIKANNGNDSDANTSMVQATPPNKKAPATPQSSDILRVEANFRGLGEWFVGRIVKERKDGTVDVDYDDGDKETNVPLDRIRPLKKSPSPRSASPRNTNADNNANNTDNDPHPYQVGDRVEGNFRNSGQYYEGVVTRIKTDATTGFHYVDITYDDGDQEKGTPINRVRKLLVEKAKKPVAKHVSMQQGGGAKPHGKKGAQQPRMRPSKSVDMGSDGGALIEVQDLDKKWYMGRILAADEVRQVADVRLLNGDVRSKVPFNKIRLPRTQTTYDNTNSGNVSSSSGRQGKAGQQQPASDIAIALNPNDLEALKLLIKQKDDEILRLRQRVKDLEGKESKAREHHHHHGSHHQHHQQAASPQVTEDINALKKANNELRTSITFLGEKFALVVDELVNVKRKEEKLARQIKQQGDELRKVFGGSNSGGKL